MSFTCIACRVSFASNEIQRSHYQTDWHRYNLKRKVAELPPVSVETFQEKVLSQRAENKPSNVGPRFCGACRKKYKSEKVYVEHLKSKRHRDNEALLEEKEAAKAAAGQDEPEEKQQKEEDAEDSMEVIEGEEDEAIEATDCLFCAHNSHSLEENLKHMARSHSFFLPDVEYLINPRGLVEYLGAKVGSGHACVWCSRPFPCTEAAQQHMLDRGHTMLNYDGSSAEYVDFYDYRSSYPDYDAAASGGDNDRETAHGQAKAGNEGEGKNEDGEEEEVEPEYIQMDAGGGELVLPSGARAGHRSLQRYYKQSVRPTRLQVAAHAQKLERLMHQYRAIGWTGSVEVKRVALEKRRRDVDAHLRRQQQHSAHLGWKANKLQNTYRRQVFLW
ncbi:cytoplasmic 60S subunit biogenesis factor ZNF622-like [Sycon ciliatum]|uniref:cytoplasmic 60S subunit biogenesis factor ZNF622-like n=1 Tax=Sycon ciliatum TaxID=27933 RepID=UPI0020AAB351|eukprot:scpid83872/ scgid29713/ Zinc finger protein 622